jgi:predicted transposase YdaD
MGLRYPRGLTDPLLPAIRNMRDSVTYQGILDEGRAEGEVIGRVAGERRLLLLFGAARLGEPDATTRARLEAISEIETLERLAGRLLTVSSWSELLTLAE